MNETPQEEHAIDLGKIIISKIIDTNGNILIDIETDEELRAYETIGMLTMALDQARKDAEYEFAEYEDEEEEP
jgi:hypothetical protein